MKTRRRSTAGRLAYLAAAIGITAFAARLWLLPAMGHFLVEEAPIPQADAAIVLNTGVEYYPRLMEAAALFREGRVPLIVIDGNRKSDTLRELEAMGFRPAAPWDEDGKRVLEILGVPRDKVVSISAEDVFDTIGEARAVTPVLKERGLRQLIIVTSKYHTRRAGHIWRNRTAGEFSITTAPARHDPFDPEEWWRSGRQIRWVLTEYGGWLFYYWRGLSERFAGV
jgi:uncharacterized SAM-binding protein YcdF (DUF218 family)